MSAGCGHPLCELIGSSCSIATGRSRGCTPGLVAKTIAPEVFDEVRQLLAVLDAGERNGPFHQAAVRLAEIVRREARNDRQLLLHARDDEPELVPALERLLVRQR